jgi:small subunit ribosomal protein S20
MAHSLSAKKRIRQNANRRALNRWRKAGYRAAIKDYRELILHGSVEEAEQKLQGLYKLLDRVGSTSTMHKNTAARYKSRLAAALNRKRSAATAATAAA